MIHERNAFRGGIYSINSGSFSCHHFSLGNDIIMKTAMRIDGFNIDFDCVIDPRVVRR